jgi:hypothetical protein
MTPELQEASRSGATGVMSIITAAPVLTGGVFFHDGMVVGVAINGRTPALGRRLVATGLVDPIAVERLFPQGGADINPQVGLAAVRAGFLEPAVLDAVHLEFLVDDLDQLLAANPVESTLHAGREPDRFAISPLPLDIVMRTLQERRDMCDQTWARMALPAGPDAIVPHLIEPADGCSMFSQALASWLDGSRTLNEAALDAGFSRFEAIVLLGELVNAGVVRCDVYQPTPTLPVPELLPSIDDDDDVSMLAPEAFTVAQFTGDGLEDTNAEDWTANIPRRDTPVSPPSYEPEAPLPMHGGSVEPTVAPSVVPPGAAALGAAVLGAAAAGMAQSPAPEPVPAAESFAAAQAAAVPNLADFTAPSDFSNQAVGIEPPPGPPTGPPVSMAPPTAPPTGYGVPVLAVPPAPAGPPAPSIPAVTPDLTAAGFTEFSGGAPTAAFAVPVATRPEPAVPPVSVPVQPSQPWPAAPEPPAPVAPAIEEAPTAAPTPSLTDGAFHEPPSTADLDAAVAAASARAVAAARQRRLSASTRFAILVQQYQDKRSAAATRAESRVEQLAAVEEIKLLMVRLQAAQDRVAASQAANADATLALINAQQTEALWRARVQAASNSIEASAAHMAGVEDQLVAAQHELNERRTELIISEENLRLAKNRYDTAQVRHKSAAIDVVAARRDNQQVQDRQAELEAAYNASLDALRRAEAAAASSNAETSAAVQEVSLLTTQIASLQSALGVDALSNGAPTEPARNTFA